MPENRAGAFGIWNSFFLSGTDSGGEKIPDWNVVGWPGNGLYYAKLVPSVVSLSDFAPLSFNTGYEMAFKKNT